MLLFSSVDLLQGPRRPEISTVELFPVLGLLAVQFEDHLQSENQLGPGSHACLHGSKRLRPKWSKNPYSDGQ